jgi:superfamily II DNA or RNA helicase
VKIISAANYRLVRDVCEVPNPAVEDEARLVERGLKRWAASVPRTLYFAELLDSGEYRVPHGAWPLSRQGEGEQWRGDEKNVAWLRPYQRKAFAALTVWDCGYVVAPCGAGKTAIGTALVAEPGRHLVIVHTQDLQRQWVQRLRDRGLVAVAVSGGAKLRAHPFADGTVTVATVQSLSAAMKPGGWQAPKFRCIVVDECHHVPARTFTAVLPRLEALAVYGLTATPIRKDGMHVALEAFVGPMRYEITRGALQAGGQTLRPAVVKVLTGAYARTADFGEMVAALVSDPHRNSAIIRQVHAFRLANRDWPQLVLTSRVAHALTLEREMRRDGLRAVAVTGDMPARERETRLAEVESGLADALIATQLADEGLDLPRLAALHLVTPARGDARGEETGGTIEQRVGRICRPMPGKPTPVVYDYVDDDSLCQSQWTSRRKVYQRLGVVEWKKVEVQQ